jgi:5'-nucleotidase
VVVAPREQQSSSGRAFYWRERPAQKKTIHIGRSQVPAIAVDASPAVSVRYGLMLGVPRRPSLVVSGINYGENMGSGLTISGTVGAALEAAADNIPALAISLETATAYHTSHSTDIDFTVAAAWTRWMVQRILHHGIPEGAPIVNVNIPSDATVKTAWRLTYASRQAYFRSIVADGRFTGYDVRVDRETLEPGSDIYAVLVDRVVSVTPLTYDLTARVNGKSFEQALRQKIRVRRKGN